MNLSTRTQTVAKIDHQLGVYHSPVPVTERPLLRRFLNSQVDLLDESLIVGEDRLVLGDLLDLPVKALDRIRRVNHGPDLRGIFEKGDDLIPVRSP